MLYKKGTKMKKTILSLILFIQVGFSATPEQLEEYLMISQADRDLIEMEQMMEGFLPSGSTKNTEMISIRFNEYLEKNLSEDELTELIELYHNPLLQILRETNSEIPDEELKEFNLSIQETPLSTERLDLNQNIIKNMFDDEDLKNLLYGLESKISEIFGQEKESQSITKEDEKAFIKEMREELKLPMLYTTQVLSMEELTELKELTDISILKKANKVELKASMYAMENFLEEMMQGIMNTTIQ